MLADDSFVSDGSGTGQSRAALHVTSLDDRGPTHALALRAHRMFDRSFRSLALCLLLVTSIARSAASAPSTVVAEAGDASIAHDTSNGGWTLSAGAVSLTLIADPARDFAVISLVSASGRAWLLGSAADTFVRTAGRTLAFGSRAAGFDFQGVAVGARGNGLELRVAYALPSAALVVTRHYAIVSGSPSFEAWTTFA